MPQSVTAVEALGWILDLIATRRDESADYRLGRIHGLVLTALNQAPPAEVAARVQAEELESLGAQLRHREQEVNSLHAGMEFQRQALARRHRQLLVLRWSLAAALVALVLAVLVVLLLLKRGA